MDIENTLTERGDRYGEFCDNAKIAQKMKLSIRDSKNWDELSYAQQEALDMICSKISRIVTGDPNYIDNWHDIIGYTRIIEKYLNEVEF